MKNMRMVVSIAVNLTVLMTFCENSLDHKFSLRKQKQMGMFSLKLVCPERSGSKFGFSMLKSPPCAVFFEHSGQPVAFDSILRFSLADTCK